MRRLVAALGVWLLLCPDGLTAQHDLPGWFDVPVPGGLATLGALGIANDERAITMAILARALEDRDVRVGLTPARVFALLNAGTSQPGEDAVTIPVPLDERAWRQLLPPPDKAGLLLRILSDRNALLLTSGLMATSDSIRTWLTRDRDLLKFIYQNGAGAFAVSARHLEIVDGRVAVPGGPQAVTVWQSLAGESPARPVPFLRALLTKDGGRLAWYFDSVAGLDDDRLAAAWRGGRLAEEATRLYEIFRDSDPQWRLQDQPFRRAIADAWTVLTQVELSGTLPLSPLPQELWSLVFSNPRVNNEHISRVMSEEVTPVSLPWIVRQVVMAPARERRIRFETFRLAQRVFANAAPGEIRQITLALSRIHDYRALMFALERMQIRDPAAWWSAATAAAHVADRANDRKESLAAFQATIALIERMRHLRTFDAATATRFIRGVCDAIQVDDDVMRSLRTWIVVGFIRALPPLVRPDAFTGKTAYESTLLQALAGPATAPEQPRRRVEWEGLPYVIDLVAAEHDRLRAMRALVGSRGLDEALASGRARDLAQALTAVVYTTALGDPEGPASLSPDVVGRHDFGLEGSSVVRDEVPWSPPEERQGFGPWHVQGALIGLDLGLSRLALRTIADEQMPTAPTLTLNDLGTLTRTAVAQAAADLSDRDRNEIAAAIERGRARVRDAGSSVAALVALARELHASPTTRESLPWMAARQPRALGSVFSLSQLLWLGRPQLSRAVLDTWGVAADGLDGRRVTAMPLPAPWENFTGRSEAGQVTTQVPDLTLRLVEETARLDLPAVLVPSLLAFALQDYWHDVQARFADDWPQLTRQAAALTSERVQDYVAALTGSGPLRTQ